MQGFTRIIERKDLRISNKLLQDKIAMGRIDSLRDVQKRLFKMQTHRELINFKYLKEVKFKFSKTNILLETRLTKKASYQSKLSDTLIKSRSNIFEFDNRIIAVKKMSTKRSDLVELKPFFEFALFKEFDFQNGLLNYGNMSSKVMNLDRIPVSRYDPIKPIRIASLLGWYLSNSNNMNQILRHFE
jgi:hypothetical protein